MGGNRQSEVERGKRAGERGSRRDEGGRRPLLPSLPALYTSCGGLTVACFHTHNAWLATLAFLATPNIEAVGLVSLALQSSFELLCDTKPHRTLHQDRVTVQPAYLRSLPWFLIQFVTDSTHCKSTTVQLQLGVYMRHQGSYAEGG